MLVAGSFSASTANSVKFSDGSEFSATNPQAPPLLQINVPLGLQYGKSNVGATISNSGNLAAGQDLVLNADKLDLQGTLRSGKDLTFQAQDQVKIRDNVSTPFWAVAGRDLLVQGNQSVDIFALNNVNSGFWSGGNMVLRSQNPAIGDAHFSAGGNFKIENLLGNLGDLSSPDDPIIRSAGDVSFSSYSGASLHIFAGGSVNVAGNITITGTDTTANSIKETVTLSDGTTKIAIDGSTKPTLDIRAGTTAFGTVGTIGTFSPVLVTTGSGTSADISIGSITNNGGDVFLTNQFVPNSALVGSISVGAINTSSSSGNAGAVVIDSKGDITSSNQINAFSTALNAGDVSLIANGKVNFASGFGIYTAVSGVGKGGNININASSVSVNDGSLLDASSFGSGNGGNITIIATDLFQIKNNTTKFTGLLSPAQPSSTGNGGNITINANKVSLQQDSQLFVVTYGQGNAGTVTIKANSVSMTDGAQIQTQTLSTGNAGNVTITATDSVSFSGRSPFGFPTLIDANNDGGFSGNAASININAKSLSVTDGAFFIAATQGGGNAGSININVTDSVLFSGINGFNGFSSMAFTSVFLNRVGNSGDININAKSVTVENGAQLNASTYGTGNAGNIKINASDFVLFSGANAIAATNVGGSVFPGALTAQPVGSIGNTGTAIGKGGNIIIDAPSVSVKDGAQLQAFTFGKGNAGSINIDAANSVLFSGKDNIGILSGAYSTVGFVNVLNAIGNAGNIEINANALSVTDGAVLVNSTWGKGNAGNITINATDSILLSGSGNGFNGISSFVNQSAIGNGGNIKVTARTLEMLNGSQISTSTASSGNAGNINLFLTQSLMLDGVGTSINAATANVSSSTGNGGSIFIDPQNVTLQNGASIFVSSFGAGIGGDIEISSNNLSLLNGAFIKAESYSANGGNITSNSHYESKLVKPLI